MTHFPDLIGANRYDTLIGKAEMTIGDIRLRAALPPLPVPLNTASGQLTHAPVVLIDLEMSSGVVGVSYLFSPRPDMLKPLMETIRALVAMVSGEPCDPVRLSAHFDQQFLLFGGTGIVTMARSALDMAMWDAIAKQHGKPLYRLLGGVSEPIHAYESSGLGLSDSGAVTQEAGRFIDNGFDHMKLRLGYPSLQTDIEVLQALRREIGDDIGLMVDYNQAMDRDEALARCTALDDFQLVWIEEPLQAADLEGAAALAERLKTPIQIGENLFSPLEVDRALSLQACDYLMPDVMKIGGVMNWLYAADRAHQKGLPVSSHLFPEISAHLLACAPNRHFLEYVNWADAILQSPVTPKNGYVTISETPGTSLAWDERAVARFQVAT
jgi:mandelate racemase